MLSLSSPHPARLPTRRTIFYGNLAIIEAHNLAGLPWRAAANEFAGYTHKEIVSRRYVRLSLRVDCHPSPCSCWHGYHPHFYSALDARIGRRCCLAVPLRFRADQTTVRASRRRFADDGTDHPALSVEALPKSVDWVKAGAVTPIQTQGQCASDWYVRGSGRGSRGAALFPGLQCGRSLLLSVADSAIGRRFSSRCAVACARVAIAAPVRSTAHGLLNERRQSRVQRRLPCAGVRVGAVARRLLRRCVPLHRHHRHVQKVVQACGAHHRLRQCHHQL